MQNMDERVQVIQSWLETLKSLVSQLDKTIEDKKAKEYLLRPVSNSMIDVEFLLSHGFEAPNRAQASMWFEMAEFQVGQAEKQLKHAQDMVAKYGANLEVIGG